ncbi:hypothetical protein AURDEDRAFT_114348 [Auricularia subglabra TFB-10046 SS5]|nr:hypothetical protein AURDEDRAFT_114348 [Auricularia subglabra TFB-10046 SS5]
MISIDASHLPAARRAEGMNAFGAGREVRRRRAAGGRGPTPGQRDVQARSPHR